MNCVNCGQRLAIGAEFCATCGAAAPRQAAPPPNPYGQVPPPNPYAQVPPPNPYVQVPPNPYTQMPPQVTPLDISSPGKKLIMIPAIIMICIYGIALLSNIGSVFTINMFGGNLRTLVIVSIMLGVVISAYVVTVSILGVLWCDKVEKGKLLVILMSGYGVLWLAELLFTNLSKVSQAMFAQTYGAEVVGLITTTSLVCAPLNLILPLLFIIGAIKNKRAN